MTITAAVLVALLLVVAMAHGAAAQETEQLQPQSQPTAASQLPPLMPTQAALDATPTHTQPQPTTPSLAAPVPSPVLVPLPVAGLNSPPLPGGGIPPLPGVPAHAVGMAPMVAPSVGLPSAVRATAARVAPTDLPPLRVPVPQLTGAELEDLVMDAKRPLLVDFFAPWCGHCQVMAPLYEEAARAMSSQPWEHQTQLVKIDCTLERETCMRHGITGFPSLKLARRADPTDLSQAVHTYEFNSQRSTLGFIVYCTQLWRSMMPRPWPAMDPSARAEFKRKAEALAEAQHPVEAAVARATQGMPLDPVVVSVSPDPAASSSDEYVQIPVALLWWLLVGLAAVVALVAATNWRTVRQRLRKQNTLPTGTSHKLM